VNGSAPGFVAVREFRDVCLEAVPQLHEGGRQHLASKCRVLEETHIEGARLTIGEREFMDFARVPTLERCPQGFGGLLGFAAVRGVELAQVEQSAEVRVVGQFDPLVAERDDHALIVAETRRERGRR
jgi:hypothetical protein